jgi:hypothetical protein
LYNWLVVLSPSEKNVSQLDLVGIIFPHEVENTMFEASTNQRMRFSSQTWECKPQTPCELGRLLYLTHQTEGSGLERGDFSMFFQLEMTKMAAA